MRKVVLYTIPSTGTRFVIHALRKVVGYRHAGNLEQFLSDPNNDVLTQFHVQNFPDNRLDRTSEFPYIVSLRHPVLSFLTQRHSPRRHPPQDGWMHITVTRWARLRAATEGRDVFFFPVETEGVKKRKALLTAMVKHVNGELNKKELDAVAKKWPVIGKTDFIHNEKREWLRTLKEEGVGSMAGIDLTPLNSAVAWYASKI